MAHHTYTRLVDDLDGSEATQTVEFGLDGKDYEIDLTSENADELRDFLSRYTSNGRRLVNKKTRRSAGRNTETPKIRAWARENGYDVADRGRIDAAILEAYRHRDQ